MEFGGSGELRVQVLEAWYHAPPPAIKPCTKRAMPLAAHCTIEAV